MLGSAGQKIARIVELAEELYERVTELREQVHELRETTVETRDRIAALEDEVAGQRRLLEALAAAEGIDVDAVGDDERPARADPDASATEDGRAAPEEGSGPTEA